MAFITRQKQIISINTLEELEQLAERQPLERAFEERREQLQKIAATIAGANGAMTIPT